MMKDGRLYCDLCKGSIIDDGWVKTPQGLVCSECVAERDMAGANIEPYEVDRAPKETEVPRVPSDNGSGRSALRKGIAILLFSGILLGAIVSAIFVWHGRKAAAARAAVASARREKNERHRRWREAEAAREAERLETEVLEAGFADMASFEAARKKVQPLMRALREAKRMEGGLRGEYDEAEAGAELTGLLFSQERWAARASEKPSEWNRRMAAGAADANAQARSRRQRAFEALVEKPVKHVVESFGRCGVMVSEDEAAVLLDERIGAPQLVMRLKKKMDGEGTGREGDGAAQPAPGGLWCTWSGRVDGMDDLVISDGGCTIRHIRWEPPRQASFRMEGARGKAEGGVSVEVTKGRGAVTVVQQPSESNGYEAVIRVRDEAPGADFYHINIYCKR